jgi:hypothetical protein
VEGREVRLTMTGASELGRDGVKPSTLPAPLALRLDTSVFELPGGSMAAFSRGKIVFFYG